MLLPLFSEVAFAHFVQLHICVDIGGIVDHHCSSNLFIISQINFRVRYPRINNVLLLRCCSEFMSYLCYLYLFTYTGVQQNLASFNNSTTVATSRVGLVYHNGLP